MRLYETAPEMGQREQGKDRAGGYGIGFHNNLPRVYPRSVVSGGLRFRASGEYSDQQEDIYDTLQHRTNHAERTKGPHPACPVTVLKYPMLNDGLPNGHDEAKNQSEAETQQRPKRTTACLPPFGQDNDHRQQANNDSRQIDRKRGKDCFDLVSVVHRQAMLRLARNESKPLGCDECAPQQKRVSLYGRCQDLFVD